MCNCPHTVEVPSANGFQNLVEKFYESNGLLAYLLISTPTLLDMPEVKCFPEFDSDGDGGFRRTKLIAELNDATNRLDTLLQMYLVHACRGEMRHFNKYGDRQTERMKLLKDWNDRAICAIHEPNDTVRWTRIVYHAFNDFSWHNMYGGKAWANIAEALLSRLEGRINISENQRTVSSFCSKPVVFIDYVLDLEHNTGSCLNKGWLNVGQHDLKAFQNKKTKTSVLDWGSHFQYEISMIKARQPIKTLEENKKTTLTSLLKQIVMTSYGSQYIVEVVEANHYWEVSSYKSDGSIKLFAKAKTKDIALWAQSKMIEALVNGTTAGKRCFNSITCNNCGYYLDKTFSCECSISNSKKSINDSQSSYNSFLPKISPKPYFVQSICKPAKSQFVPKPAKTLFIDLSKFSGCVSGKWMSSKNHKFKSVDDLCVHYDNFSQQVWVSPSGNPSKVLIKVFVNNTETLVEKLCVAIKQMGLKSGSIGNYYLKYGDVVLSESSTMTHLPYINPTMGDKIKNVAEIFAEQNAIIKKDLNKKEGKNKAEFVMDGPITIYFDSNGNEKEKYINLDLVKTDKVFDLDGILSGTGKHCGIKDKLGNTINIYEGKTFTILYSGGIEVGFVNGYVQLIIRAIQDGYIFGDISKYKYYYKGKCVSK